MTEWKDGHHQDLKAWLQEIEDTKEINRKKRSVKRKAHYQKNKLSIGVANKNWRVENSERVKEYNKAYYQKNKEAK